MRFLGFLSLIFLSSAAHAAPFKIQVVDEQTGRGVPLVELRTVSNTLFVTDSNGVVAFDEPSLMNEDVFFSVSSHGYEFPKDGFGYRGKTLRAVPGGSAQLKIKRLNIAERLYRLTGEGIYRDSVLCGDKVPLEKPLINGKVLGQDTVMATPYKGKIYWFWGDTNRPAYPLGNFHTSGATSLLPGKGGLKPGVGVNYDYFVNNEGFCRAMVKLPPKDGATLIWIDGLMTLPDEAGNERLVARYAHLKSLTETVSIGLIAFNDATQTFELLKEFDAKTPLHPRNYPFQTNGYFYFPAPLPNLRVRATWQAIQSPELYEAYSPLKPGTRFHGAQSELERDANGKLIWAWKPNTAPLSMNQQNQLIKAGKMRAEETPFAFVDADSGKPIEAHNGSVFWNDYRKKYVMIFVQAGGSSSYLGEVFYAESPTLEGPWQRAKKILTHQKYTFYNPVQHPFFDEGDGRFIYFEGTYCNTFSGNDNPTPRYDYNQIMYRLDLSDARLHG
jgi:hypothetical protein